MKIREIIFKLDLYDFNGDKLKAVKLIWQISHAGLKESKEIADRFFKKPKFGKTVIEFLKNHHDWKVCKSKIRKLNREDVTA